MFRLTATALLRKMSPLLYTEVAGGLVSDLLRRFLDQAALCPFDIRVTDRNDRPRVE
jgi:hypothetical protein